MAGVGSLPAGSPTGTTWATYIWVQSADATAAAVEAAGGSVLAAPFDVMAAGRMALCADPEGAAFCLWQAKSHRGARIVNEPGSLNFNGLNTRDPDGAKSFYGSVFGWETLGVGDSMVAWRLPGYGDFLAQSDPEIRARMAQSGAPAGFEDVVATLGPIPDDQTDVPAHWSVTFAVDDADAVAAKAAELRRSRDRRAVRRSLGEDDRDRRSPGRHVHREQVRARERGRPQRGRTGDGSGVDPAPRVRRTRCRDRRGVGSAVVGLLAGVGAGDDVVSVGRRRC